MMNTNECVICLESLNKNNTQLKCNHIYHKKCIAKWFINHEKCPLCNIFIQKNNYSTFINNDNENNHNYSTFNNNNNNDNYNENNHNFCNCVIIIITYILNIILIYYIIFGIISLLS